MPMFVGTYRSATARSCDVALSPPPPMQDEKGNGFIMSLLPETHMERCRPWRSRGGLMTVLAPAPGDFWVAERR